MAKINKQMMWSMAWSICGATNKNKNKKSSGSGNCEPQPSEDKHKFTQLRGLVGEGPLQEKLQKTNRKFIQLRRLAGVSLRICGRRHGVSPYNHPPFKTASPRCRTRNENGMELKKRLRLGCVEVRLGCVEVRLGVFDRSRLLVLEHGLL